jgi:hypothetical protein
LHHWVKNFPVSKKIVGFQVEGKNCQQDKGCTQTMQEENIRQWSTEFGKNWLKVDNKIQHYKHRRPICLQSSNCLCRKAEFDWETDTRIQMGK